MNKVTALGGMALLVSAAIYYSYKASKQKDSDQDHKVTYFLVGGFLVGLPLGAVTGFYAITNMKYEDDGSYVAWIFGFPFAFSMIGAIIGLIIDKRMKMKRLPNKAL